ncbi:MAG: peptidoglycan-binding protein [Mojavia pulchra JT2-VF2]|jgi:hypothetical protein|uniref:Peptidoglycan-binding protein n=1 Tax=Mojavia pulchra JT2-VF2 TaxID=287848 RepID=A0A951PYM2_9NOST|nr:peptidoglycan-binding protein [Mojavia pulchra JT2-VF2]
MQLTDTLSAEKTISFENVAQDAELAKHIQINLIRLRLLDPPADGKFGQFSIKALTDFQSLLKISEAGLGLQTAKALIECKEAIPLKLGNDFASRIVKYMQNKKYYIAVGKQQYNIVYVEGVNANGTLNNDKFNQWNDRRIVIEIASGTPQIVGNWVATTEPGDYYTKNPPNPKGVARIAFGQYNAWRVGYHYGTTGAETHEALEQCGTIKVHRDRNKDGLRSGDPIDVGSHFFINQHWGYDKSLVSTASAGCLVGQSREEHKDFMQLIKQDRRYRLDNKYVFWTTIIPGDDLAKNFPA